MIKKTGKILAYILTGIIGLLLLLLLLIHTGSLNSVISGIITKQVSNSIRGELSINTLTGSVFNQFSFHEVKVSDGDSVLLYAKDIRISYSLPAILNNRILIHELQISHIDVYASQQRDSTWNVLNSFQPLHPPSRERDTTGSGFIRSIEVTDLEITSLTAIVNPRYQEEVIPQEIKALLELKLQMEDDRIALDLQRFELRSSAPDMLIRHMSGFFSKEGEILQWKDFSLKLTETDLSSAGILPLDNLTGADVEIIFSPFAFSDIRPFMTKDTLYGTPDLEILYEGKDKRKEIAISISTKTQRVEVDGWLEGLEAKDSYYMHIIVDSLNGATWTGDRRLKTLITGVMELDGTGFDFQKNVMDFHGKYDTIRYSDYAANKVIVNIEKTADNASGEIEVSSNRGNLFSHFNLSHIFDTINYDLTSRLSGIDISSFAPETELKTNLNMLVEAKGSGVDLNTLNTAIYLESSNSRLLDRPIDYFEAWLTMDRGMYEFNGLDMQTPFFRLFAEGEGDIYSDNNIMFQLEPFNLNPLLEPYKVPKIQLDGQISGTVSGQVDSLNLVAELTFDSIRYDSIGAVNFYSNFDVNLIDSSYNGKIDLNSAQVYFGDIKSDSIHLTSVFSEKELDNFLYLKWNDSISADIHSLIEIKEVPLIFLPKINIDLSQSTWQGGSDSTYFALGKDTIRINQFKLNNGTQSISAHGRFAFKGDENLQLAIRNVDLSDFGFLSPSLDDMQGLLFSDINLQGTAQSPEVKGDVRILKPVYQDIALNHFQFDVEYQNELLAMTGALDDTLKQRFHADIELPVHISLRDSMYLLEDNDNFRADIRIDSLNTKLFNPYFESIGMQSEGNISANVGVSNTLRQPDIKGGIGMQSGNINYSEMGVVYEDIGLEVSFTGERITLDKLEMHSGDGSLEASGYAGVDFLSKEKLKNMDLQISAKNFKLMEIEKGSAAINSNFKINGPYDDAQIDGQLTILQSTINTDVILAEQSLKSDNPNPPLLIQAMKDTLHSDTTTDYNSVDTVNLKNNIFYNNLSGTVVLNVPGNSWVKGKDMNFELQGELRAVKEGPQIDLFGELNVNRGYYKFYGKQFSFNKGKITFTGGREINPQVDFEVTYSFRDEERELRELKLFLTGRALNPDIRFTMDDVHVEEKDAIAYILFGRRLDNLTTQQTASVEQGTLNLTRDIAMGQISNLLKDALQGSLQLDVVEISGGDSWKSGKVTIGKYITNDLYVRYEQNFAFDKKNKIIDPQEIALEYQIIRSLFLQATNQRENSGFDLIFKKSWK